MNAHPTSPRIPNQRLSKQARHFFCCIAGRTHLLAGAILLLLLGAASQAPAQAISNCLQVICPPPFVTNYVCNDQPVAQPYPLVVSNNCPGLQVSVNCTPPPTTPFGPGSHPVHCVVAANGVVVAQCDFTVVVVIDTIPPLITCPTNFVVRTCPSPTGGCGANVLYPPPVASDNSGSVAVTCVPPSGSFFPCGVNPVVCTAEDRCGNKRSCTFTITVNDQGQPPTITCPPDLTLLTCSNGAVLAYPTPAAPPGTTVTCVPPPGTLVPVGASIGVTCTASNACGTAQCAFKVEVRPVPPPTIICPTNEIVLTVPCGSNCVPVTYPAPVVINGTLMGCQPTLGTCLPVGNYFIICRATNICGDLAGCEFPVHVIQGQGNGPVISCPSNIVVTTCSNCAVVNYPTPVLSDGVLVKCMPPSGSCFPIGSTTVTCTATNDCGQSECEFVITVRPVPPPIILCPTNELVFTVPCGSNCVPVIYPAPTVINGTLMGCQPPSGTCLPVGNYFIICRATNICGDVAGCEFPVHVIQGQGNGPVISCPSNIVVTTCSNCAVVNYPTPVLSDGVLVKCMPPSGSCFPLGSTIVNCTATNDCGRSECEFTITVRPVPPPVILCPTNELVFTVPCGSNCVPVIYPAPTVINGTLMGCQPPSGTCLPVGNYFIICRATNICGDIAGCEFPVRVIQGQGNGPVLTCPSNIVVTTCSNCAVVNYPTPVISSTVLAKCTPPSGSCFPIGLTIVTCTATNDCGRSECEFVITVRPVPPPTILCPSNQVVVVPCLSNCVPVFYPAPVVNNGVLIGCTPPSGACLAEGLHPVICRASNECGVVVGCEFSIRVLPGQGEPPLIQCPHDITVTTCSNCAVVLYPFPAVVNGVLLGCTPPSGFCFPIGSTIVNCEASNACGRAECKFTVTVRPVPEVAILCPSNIIVTTCANGVNVNYPPPTLSTTADAAGVAVFCDPPSGSFFPVGTNHVTCCVIDQCQRTNCCTFLVIVVPGNPCVKPPLNMVLWLPFDEPAGVIAQNIVPGAPNGLHLNGPVPLIGQFVLNSRVFDGINDYTRVPNYAAIVLSSSDFSIDAWVLRRDTDQGRRVIVSKLGKVPGALGPRGYEYYLNNGVMNLFLGGPVAQNFSSGVVVPLDNGWHHVTVTVRRFGAGASVRFYLDGALVNTQAGPITAPIGSSSALYVGAGTFPVPNSFFGGFIDEVEIFNRVLTPAEIVNLWIAKTAGKCKIKCSIPWDVAFPPNGNYVTVQATICNYSGVPQPINWVASGPMPIPTPNGSFILPPFTCTNFPVQLCRPTNGVPVGTVVQWTLSVYSGTQCPQRCVGSVINPGPVIVVVPTGPVVIAGTNRIVRVGLSVDGLVPSAPGRIRVMGPDMEPDTRFVSLNGLPPGTPVLFGAGGGGAGFSPAASDIPLTVRFADADPVGGYAILLEADLDGDGQFETLGSFDAENPVVAPPTIQILKDAPGYHLDWQDEGDGFGVLESSDTVDGTWSPIPGAGPGYPLDLLGAQKFFRVAVPYVE